MEGLNEDQGGVEVSNGRAKPCYPVLVCVDGLISSGKSTLLSNLKEKGFITYPEPLSEWKGQLERFYANPKKEFLNTQSFILDSQIKLKEKLVQLFYSPDKAPAKLATAPLGAVGQRPFRGGRLRKHRQSRFRGRAPL